jgi:hypothetical protein
MYGIFHLKFNTSILHFNKKGNPEAAFLSTVVFIVVVESTTVEVLSVDPDTFFVELHAEAANNSEPAKARLKIVLFILYIVLFI